LHFTDPEAGLANTTLEKQFFLSSFSQYYLHSTTISVCQRAQTRKQQDRLKSERGTVTTPLSFPRPRVKRPRRHVRLKKRVEISVHVGSGHAMMDADTRGGLPADLELLRDPAAWACPLW